MADSGYRHFIIIMDRSGSMARIRSGMQSGYGEFIAMQSLEPGRATASLWQYNSSIERVHSFQPLGSLTSYQLIPRGMTAMYDAIGLAATEEGAHLAALPEDERPSAVVMLIVSDGLENSSTEFTGAQIAAMLKHQQEAYNWQVLYLGTNQDAFTEGAKVGVAAGATLNYANTDAGSRGAWSATSNAISRATRSSFTGQAFSVTYSAGEREEAQGGEG